MAIIGVILLLIGAGAAVVTYIGAQAAGGTITLTALGFSRTVSPVELALYAAVAVLLVALGWALLSAATRRRVRARREDKDAARLAEVEEKAETARLDHEQRFEEAGLRDEDLRRRESELTARHEGLDRREAELARREAEWRERQGPSVADVVTGRAEGNVHEGTASWAGGTDGTDGTDAADDTYRTDGTDDPYRTDRRQATDRVDGSGGVDGVDGTDTTTGHRTLA
jgi:membrane protein implicated in regulation of membrane protease activity